MLSVRALSKSFGRKPVLSKIDLELTAGSIHGIVGENGAGKTTLFRCIAGLEDHTGEVKTSLPNLKNLLGFLPTNPHFLSRITGWEYLKLMCVARGIKEEGFDHKNIFDLPLNQYAETYSTGMKKKLALLAILLQHNEIFILDEPFNGVDIQSNMLISKIMMELKAKRKLVLISSHIFSTLREQCDEIHLLKEGRIAQTATGENFDALDDQMQGIAIDDKLSRLGI